MAVGGNPWGEELFDNNFQAIMKIADPTKLPAIPEHLSASCKDFIVQCLNRTYDMRPTAEQLAQHQWLQ